MDHGTNYKWKWHFVKVVLQFGALRLQSWVERAWGFIGFKSSKHELACVAGVHFQNHVKGTKREISHPRRARSLARLLDLSPRLGNGKEVSATQVKHELELG